MSNYNSLFIVNNNNVIKIFLRDIRIKIDKYIKIMED